MKYISQLTPDQIKEVMEIYSPSHTELDYTLTDYSLDVSVRCKEGIEENYVINDYDVEIYDWMGGEAVYLRRFRVKMLSWFGKHYAIDYLLGQEE